jgi:transmembrane sensor
MEKMDEIFYKRLVQRYADGHANEAEMEVFFHLLKEGKLEKYLESHMNKAAEIEVAGAFIHKIFNWKRWIAAASIILAIGIGSYFIFFNRQRTEPTPVAKNTDIEAPKSTKATITLADGSIISVDSLNTLVQGDVKLMRTSEGKLVYQVRGQYPAAEIQYNTLINPRGSKVIDMQLSDGSRVWLNAGSSVTYPVAFTGNERKVNITGEVYFEVVHDAMMPFKVTKGNMEVTVLGTFFNVNAYEDEAAIKVTLLEGEVNVKRYKSNVRLNPGDQASIQDQFGITIRRPDLEEVMAWKNGTFYFNNTNIRDIMRQAARWYDVEIGYEGNVTNEFFGGTVPRTENISQLIKALELTKTVKIELKGKKVIVKPAK